LFAQKYFLLFIFCLAISTQAHAVQLSSNFTADILVAGAYQAINADGTDNPDGSALPILVSLDWTLSDKSHLYTRLGFANGNRLEDESPFNLDPWGAHDESDFKNINGTNRDHLLTAWYRHTFIKEEGQHFDIALGIIDGTDYLDQNVFSNNEYTQFMNSVLVNAPNIFIPSYNPGVGAVWGKGAFSARFAYMRLKENNDGNEGDYVAFELDYLISTRLGYGQYRVTLAHTDKSYFDLEDDGLVSRRSMVFSFDQQLGEGIGVFTRFGLQDDRASIDYKSIVSGGFQFDGENWGRTTDTIGLAFASLQNGNEGLSRTQVYEGYYRVALNDVFAATADIQYMDDKYVDASSNVNGWVYGIRLVAEF
jgi:porin